MVPVTSSAPSLAKDITNRTDGSWNLNLVRSFISSEECSVIERFPLGDLSSPDRLIWPWTLNGDFSVNSGWVYLPSYGPPVSFC
ncbi:unnamed protein product [Malus baccata var. baccata]